MRGKRHQSWQVKLIESLEHFEVDDPSIEAIDQRLGADVNEPSHWTGPRVIEWTAPWAQFTVCCAANGGDKLSSAMGWPLPKD